MKIKLLLSGIFFLVILNVFSQIDLNSYKYIIVPKKFDFLKENNQYQMNDLAHFLFGKYGFKAVKEGDDYPVDLRNNRCLGLHSDVIKDSGMFKTKLKVELKDCNDKIVYTSQIGESREKEYRKAYNYALRDAFKHLEALNYSYEPNESMASLTTAPGTPEQSVAGNKVSKEIQELKAEIENLKKQKEEAKAEAEKEELALVPKQKQETIPVIAEKSIESAKHIQEKTTSNVLYAQPITSGFQLVDSSPKVIYRINKTGLDNVYLVEGKSAILFKKGSDWVIEYYVGGVLKTDTLNIKF